jgi:hypothetical protein
MNRYHGRLSIERHGRQPFAPGTLTWGDRANDRWPRTRLWRLARSGEGEFIDVLEMFLADPETHS